MDTNRDSVLKVADEASAAVEITEEDDRLAGHDQGDQDLQAVPDRVLDHALWHIVEETMTDIALLQGRDRNQVPPEEATEEKVLKMENKLTPRIRNSYIKSTTVNNFS